jgi:hypothetical protein
MLRIFVHHVNYGPCSGRSPTAAPWKTTAGGLDAQSQQSRSACLQCTVMQALKPASKRGTTYFLMKNADGKCDHLLS